MNQRFKIQISNRPGFGIQIKFLYEPTCAHIRVSRIHYIFEGGIRDSNLNPRKMAGIQDSNLVFKGPISETVVCESLKFVTMVHSSLKEMQNYFLELSCISGSRLHDPDQVKYAQWISK